MGASLGASFVVQALSMGRSPILPCLFSLVRDLWDARKPPVNLSRKLRRFEPFTRHHMPQRPVDQLEQVNGPFVVCPAVEGRWRLFCGPFVGHAGLARSTAGCGQRPDERSSPLAKRPYDLRHPCVSSWLAAGVEPTKVAA